MERLPGRYGASTSDLHNTTHTHTIYLVALLSVGQSAGTKTKLLVHVVVLWEKLITNNSISIKGHCQRVPGTASGHCPRNSITPLSSPSCRLSGLSGVTQPGITTSHDGWHTLHRRAQRSSVRRATLLPGCHRRIKVGQATIANVQHMSPFHDVWILLIFLFL